jgi:LuxR family maltose regulon positive regulatory protein
LTECLSLAEPEGYTRIFLNERQPLQALLDRWLAYASIGPLRDYASHLRSQFDAEPNMITTARVKSSPKDSPGGPGVIAVKDSLIEPLSQRELEVLHLIAMGRSNQEIAQQLIVAPGTVKAHAASIYRKLDVSNRTEAAARARQLRILT